MRSFCPDCGTGLWFRNADNLPGIVEATANVEATMLQVPMSWIYASVPVSAGIMLAYQVERTLRRISGTLPPGALPGDEQRSA